MNRVIHALAVGMLLGWSAPAMACMASGPDGYSAGFIWKNAPSQKPENSILLNVSYIKPVEGTWGFVAKVNDGPVAMVGKSYRIGSQPATSCDGLGRLQGYIVVRRELIEWPVGVNGTPARFLNAVSYQPSWWNELLRFFGGKPWAYPGHMMEYPESPV